jgi:lysophospholipase L1-like esterase
MLHAAAKYALAPLLYRQAGRIKRTAVELPEPHGERSGVAGDGAPRLRVLVAGDSSAAGVGARTQDDALAAPLARNLARRLNGVVRWQLVAQSGLTSEGVLHKLMHGHVQPADIAVVICGVNDITKEQPASFALRKRRQIAEWVCAHAGVRHVLFPALPEMELFPAIPQPLAWWAGQAARRNNRLQARWARDFDFITHVPMDGITHPSLFCEDGFHPAPGLYARVADRLAELIADQVLPRLQAQHRSNGRTSGNRK